MRKEVFKVLSALFQGVDRILCKMHIKHPKIIIYLDGGICSQMLMYLNGQLYADMKMDINYDARWFASNGKDMYGNFDRKFELTTLFPNLPYKEMKPWKCRFYRIFFRYPQTGVLPRPETITCSAYLGDYFELPEDDLTRLWEICFRNEPRCTSDKHIIRHEKEALCAVHVRRGDLADYEDEWYKRIPISYFQHAIDYVQNKYQDVRFCFFSDEPDWVEQHICGVLPKGTKYEIEQGNKAYEDLTLISECDAVIASQGSFGRYGAKLNGKSELIMFIHTAENQRNLDGVTYIE